MHSHVEDLTLALSNTAQRVSNDPNYIMQARTVAYIGSKVIYAMGQQARFHATSPYFAFRNQGGAANPVAQGQQPAQPHPPLRAVAAQAHDGKARASTRLIDGDTPDDLS